MSISIDTIRVGKKYYLVNHGERHEFKVMEKLMDRDFAVQDLHTLEKYTLADLIRYGKGKDYELHEL